MKLREASRRCDSRELQQALSLRLLRIVSPSPAVTRGGRRVPRSRSDRTARAAGRSDASRRRGAGARMSLRSATARWFELLTSREELGAALDCLAQTRSVELQAYSRAESRLPLGDLKRVLDDFEALARRFRPWWPAALPCTVDAEHELLDAPQAALGRLRAWATAAEPVVAELEALSLERTEIEMLGRLCAIAGSEPAASRSHGVGRARAGQPHLRAAARHAGAVVAAGTDPPVVDTGARARDVPDRRGARRRHGRTRRRTGRAQGSSHRAPSGPAAGPARTAREPRATTHGTRHPGILGTRRAGQARRGARRAGGPGRGRAGRLGRDARAGASGHGALRVDHRLVCSA